MNILKRRNRLWIKPKQAKNKKWSLQLLDAKGIVVMSTPPKYKSKGDTYKVAANIADCRLIVSED